MKASEVCMYVVIESIKTGFANMCTEIAAVALITVEWGETIVTCGHYLIRSKVLVAFIERNT